MGLRSRRQARLTQQALLAAWPENYAGPELDPGSLTRLARWPDVRVRRQIAHYPGAPAEAIEILATDTDSDTRWMAQRHRNLPEHIMYQLATTGSPSEKEAIAAHPKASVHLLEVLSNDEYYPAAVTAMGRDETSLDTLRNVATRSGHARASQMAASILRYRITARHPAGTALLYRALVTGDRTKLTADAELERAITRVDALDENTILVAEQMLTILDENLSMDAVIAVAKDTLEPRADETPQAHRVPLRNQQSGITRASNQA